MTDAQLRNAVTASFLHLGDAVWAAHDPIRPYLVQFMKELMPDQHVDLDASCLSWKLAQAAACKFLACAPDDFFADPLVVNDAEDSSLMTFANGMVVYCEPKRLTDLRLVLEPKRSTCEVVTFPDLRVDGLRVGLDAPYC